MRICAIIAEFNPFHNGHAYLIEQVRHHGYTHIIVVMSGNFVQRGEPAIVSKDVRTLVALKSNVNLIIELPISKVISTAEKYANSGISLINSLGCVDAIAFGMEAENIECILNIENALRSKNFHKLIKTNLSKGISFAKAREQSLEEIVGKENLKDEIRRSNNILAVEYIKAINDMKLSFEILGIRRLEDPDFYLSASKIRELIKLNNNSYVKYIPEFSYCHLKDKIIKKESPADIFSLSSQHAVLSRLRGLDIKDISALPDISEGIENRIFKAIKRSTSVSELLFNIKTKRYALSRIRRIILSAFIGITYKESNNPLNYIRVLGMDEKGKELLKVIKQKSKLPIITKYKDVLKCGEEVRESFEKESKFNDFYGLLTTKILECDLDKNFKLIKG